YSRAPVHARQFSDRLAAGDLDTIRTLGLPPGMTGPALLTPQGHAMVAPLIDRAAYVEAINDAWAFVALVTVAAILVVPLARPPASGPGACWFRPAAAASWCAASGPSPPATEPRRERLALPQVPDAHRLALRARHFARRLDDDVAGYADPRLDVLADLAG